MDVIDRNWLIERLGNDRGTKAELCRAIGLDPPKLSRILAGRRRITNEEAALMFEFFHPDRVEGSLSDEEAELVSEWRKITPEDRQLLRTLSKELASRRQ